MNTDHLTFRGPPVSDPEMLDRAPHAYAELLQRVNGFIAYSGGLHVRGACLQPTWHSLRDAWEGPAALHRLFDAVLDTDVPFGQDAFGDQLLLRDDTVVRLSAESGTVEPLGVGFQPFLARVEADPVDALDLAPLQRFLADGGRLEPGMLLSVYPPFVAAESANGVSLEPVPAAERIAFLATLARRIANLPDGGTLNFGAEA